MIVGMMTIAMTASSVSKAEVFRRLGNASISDLFSGQNTIAVTTPHRIAP
jgi:hypothetical protein